MTEPSEADQRFMATLKSMEDVERPEEKANVYRSLVCQLADNVVSHDWDPVSGYLESGSLNILTVTQQHFGTKEILTDTLSYQRPDTIVKRKSSRGPVQLQLKIQNCSNLSPY